ncbi:hypothetical protein C8R44DRAFT_600569, partial [Mycena epipterygia]
GACGEWHQDSEYVVALTQLEWNNGANCGKEVYITYNGMSAVAKIVDECEECPFGALDFSQALFGHFVGGEQNNLEVGYIYGAPPLFRSPSFFLPPAASQYPISCEYGLLTFHR